MKQYKRKHFQEGIELTPKLKPLNYLKSEMIREGNEESGHTINQEEYIEEIIGYNRVNDNINLKDVPDEIYRSHTDRYYILFDDNSIPANEEELVERTKIFEKHDVIIVSDDNIENIKDLNNELSTTNLLFYPDLGFAVTTLLDTQIKLVELQNNSFKIEKEYLMKICDSAVSTSTLNDITITHVKNISENPITAGGWGTGPEISDSTTKEVYYRWSWGIDKVKANYSIYRGSNVNIAVLDTGIDLEHPDFDKYRTIVAHNTAGEDPQDYDGHGTHCMGIACGFEGEKQIRYGVAYNSNIFSCKVVDDNGIISQDSVQRGIRWALKNNCKVISISLEFTNRKAHYNRAFEKTIYKALERDCLVVVAAGNNSDRDRRINSLGAPANSPSALAVGAIDRNDGIYVKSNQAGTKQHMSFTAPGVDIYSSWSTTGQPAQPYRIMSGTSMAAPYVAGLIALLWDSHADDETIGWDDILPELERKCFFAEGKWISKDVGHGLPLAH